MGLQVLTVDDKLDKTWSLEVAVGDVPPSTDSGSEGNSQSGDSDRETIESQSSSER